MGITHRVTSLLGYAALCKMLYGGSGGPGPSRALFVGMAPLVRLAWVESAALGWAFLFFLWERMVWLLRGWISGVQGW